MNIFTALREGIDLQRGRAKARLDVKLVEAFELDHQHHHNSDPEWDCKPASREFYRQLMFKNEQKYGENPVLHFGYCEVIAKWQQKNAGRFGNPLVIPVEGGLNFNEDTPPEEVAARLRQMIQDHFDLQALEDDSEEGK